MTKKIDLDEHVFCHAVTEKYQADTDVEFWVEEIRTKGFTVMPGSFGADSIANMSACADESYRIQCDLLGGEENLVKINDANIARAPCAEFDIFIDLAMDPLVHAVASILLGRFMLYSQNAIINKPGTNHYQFTWHRDLNYQHWTSSRSMALSALYCLDPFDSETGGTYVLPATHKVEKFPSERYVLANQQCVHARPGDWILFDSMVFHRTGKNGSKIVRRGINHIIVPLFMAQQYDFIEMIGTKLKTGSQRMFFGEGRRVPPSALAWRQARIDRK